MAKIPLARRTQLPPSRVGEVKPPLSLADDTTAQAGALLAEKVRQFQVKLVNTKAANEIATFQGERKTILKEWEAFVAANPGEGFDVLQKENDRMMTRIELAGQQATTGIAKRANATWLAENKTVVRASSQLAMQDIKTEQEVAIYRQLQENNLARFDPNAYIAAKNNMVESGLLNKELADAKQVEDFAIMAKAQDKVNQTQAIAALEQITTQTAAQLGWQAAIDDLARPETIAGLTEAGISLSDSRQILTNMQAFAATQQDVQREEDRQGIVDLMIDNRFINIENRINDTSLDATEKIEWINKANTRAKAIADGKDDPYEQTDLAFQAELLRRGDYTKKDLDDALGKGRNRGLSISVYNSMLKNIGDGSRSNNADYNHGIKVLDSHRVNNGFFVVPRAADATDAEIAAAEAENLFKWSESNVRFDKFFDDFQEKNERSPNADEVNGWLETEMFPTFIETVTRGFWNRAFGRAGALAEAIVVPGVVPIGLLPDIDIEALQSRIDNLSDEDRAALNELRSETGTITASEAENFLRQRGLD